MASEAACATAADLVIEKPIKEKNIQMAEDRRSMPVNDPVLQ